VIFTDFQAALEEAAWCANEEKRKYILRFKNNSYEVIPKYRKGVKRYRHIEVGFRRSSND
jgi:hypothetical protein